MACVLAYTAVSGADSRPTGGTPAVRARNRIGNLLLSKAGIPLRKALSLFIALLLFISVAGCGASGQPEVAVQISYDTAVVSYLGPEGTYTQEACGLFFEKRGTYVPCGTVADAVGALIAGESDYAVIPQENTIGGPVIDYVDTLIAQTAVSVVGEVELPISQNLLALPGTEPGGIRTVYSHKQGIAQGRAWLEENLPDAEVIEVSSTAEGARMVSEAQDPACAAIASAACADVYGLEILAAGIQNSDNNKTRFYVLSLQAPATAQATTSPSEYPATASGFIPFSRSTDAAASSMANRHGCVLTVRFSSSSVPPKHCALVPGRMRSHISNTAFAAGYWSSARNSS